MTRALWLLAVVGFTIWSATGLAMGWSIVALHYGYQTTSHFMAQLPRGWVFLVGILLGAIVGFVGGHWWPLSSR